MNFRLAQPSVLVDLNRVTELDYIRSDEDGLVIGAMTRQRAVERDPIVPDAAPLLAEAMPHVAHPQIRNRGTIGGSLAHADPAAELPAVALALNAVMRVRGTAGGRTLPADEFFTGLFGTALAPDELLIQMTIPPLPPATGCAFAEFSRRHGDYAMAGAAVTVQLDKDGKCAVARIVLLSVGGGPVSAVEAGRLLEGELPTEEAVRAAADAAMSMDVDPPADIHASAEYRRHLVGVLVRRLIPAAVDRARGAGG